MFCSEPLRWPLFLDEVLGKDSLSPEEVARIEERRAIHLEVDQKFTAAGFDVDEFVRLQALEKQLTLQGKELSTST